MRDESWELIDVCIFLFADEPSTSDRVDLRSALRSLQELLLQENYPLEISSLLYLILKDTPEPKKAYNRIVEGMYTFFNK